MSGSLKMNDESWFILSKRWAVFFYSWLFVMKSFIEIFQMHFGLILNYLVLWV